MKLSLEREPCSRVEPGLLLLWPPTCVSPGGSSDAICLLKVQHLGPGRVGSWWCPSMTPWSAHESIRRPRWRLVRGSNMEAVFLSSDLSLPDLHPRAPRALLKGKLSLWLLCVMNKNILALFLWVFSHVPGIVKNQHGAIHLYLGRNFENDGGWRNGSSVKSVLCLWL